MEQFATQLGTFTSQYGSDNSSSYVVRNIIGAPNCYPSYGDFTEAAVLRTYGPWWKSAPESPTSFDATTDNHFISDDIIELIFAQKVYIDEVHVYETYNPGAVVRILAYDDHSSSKHGRWHVLWEQPRGKPHLVPKSSRIFIPPIKPSSFPTTVIRLEFNHDLLYYYTEIDAVKIVGHTDVDLDQVTLYDKTDDNGLTCAISRLSLDNPTCYFDDLPDELLDLIIHYLSVKEQGLLACTSKRFHFHCYDPYQKLYRQLNLQPYWYLIDDCALEGFAKKCQNVEAINMNWCGSQQLITESGSLKFFKALPCSSLRNLTMNSCPFLNDAMIPKLLAECTGLTELSLAGSSTYLTNLHSITALTKLKRLDIYGSHVNEITICAIICSCPDLEYLNLGACSRIDNFNNVAVTLANGCPKLKGVDFWRAKSLHSTGIYALADHCPALESLDLGWCSNLHRGQSEISCTIYLTTKCPNLRKLALTANRSVSDADLRALAMNSSELEQLDILGSNAVSANVIELVLMGCKNLTFFDISFCQKVDFQRHDELQKKYKSCKIKKSFTE